MKKIFAIALALVMVLSMTAAFAACPTIDWACATSVCTDGKGAVEVIPYVKGNTCGGNSWTANTCAGAINNDPVYFAVKVTVEANPNLDWWAKAKMEVSTKGMKKGTDNWYVHYSDGTAFGGFGEGDVDNGIVALDTKSELKAGEYYLVHKTTGWAYVKAADFDPATDGLFTAVVDDAAKAKVCFTLKSSVEAVDAGWLAVGDYYVRWYQGDIQVSNKTAPAAGRKVAHFDINSSDLIEKVTYQVWDANENKSEYVLTGFGFVDTNGASVGVCAPFDWLAKVMEYFKFDFRTTCYTAKAFNANFGWEDKVESCFSWSDKVVSVVDAECVVAIPKTGDKSVLAWLF